ncbi:MAG TPA: RidA family protein [Candidatus Blautia ornithocaccae]|nr:RidA family protein [Candidatus Blautia ornithocaccae]
MSIVEEKLKGMGYTIPECPKAAGAYVPAVRTEGGLLFVSGQTAIVDDKQKYVGIVGKDISLEEAYDAARIAALRLLAEVKYAIGDLDRVERIVKVNGYVNAMPGFEQHPKVINGASEFLEEVFGEKGKHARAAIGAGSLPDNAPVEVEMIIEFK